MADCGLLQLLPNFPLLFINFAPAKVLSNLLILIVLLLRFLTQFFVRPSL